MKISKLTASAIALIALLVAGCNEKPAINTKPTEASKKLDESRYVQIFTDPETHCQYITTMDGGITPRLAANGSHFGCDYNN